MRKHTLLIILMVLVINIGIISDVNAASNPYKKNSRFGVNCTWYAWDQVYRKAGIALPGWGNADTWLNYAKKAGYQVGSTPKAKSIVVWSWSNYGHVGYVERVSGDKIYVWDSQSSCIDENDPEFRACADDINNMYEQGYNNCVRDYGKPIACEYPAGYWQSPGDLIGYIYLDRVPKTPKTTTKKKTTIKTTTTQAKSSNSHLSSLVIEGIELDFNKENYEYVFNVKNEISSIKINAVAEDELSTIQGVGEHPLKVGENIFEIVVTAEDNTTSTYIIKVNREKEIITTTKKIIKKKKTNNKIKDYIFMGILVGLGIIVCVVTILIIRKKK